MKAFISENELLEEATPACVFQPAWCRERWSGCRLPPCAQKWYNTKNKKRRTFVETDVGKLFFPLRPILGQAPVNTAWLWLLCLLCNRTMTCFLGVWPVSNKHRAKWDYLTCSLCSLCPGSVTGTTTCGDEKKCCLSLRFKCFYVDVYSPNAKLS